jgi:CheY-specific phosphatase CheX
MIAEQMAHKLRHAAKSVLEMMFMAPVLADQEFPPQGAVDLILIGLRFSGKAHGTFALAVEATVAERLARSFLCMEAAEPLDRQAIIEVLSELANMLCGHFLGQLDSNHTFRLSSPGEQDLPPSPPKGHSYQRTVHLDQGTVSMQVVVET